MKLDTILDIKLSNKRLGKKVSSIFPKVMKLQWRLGTLLNGDITKKVKANGIPANLQKLGLFDLGIFSGFLAASGFVIRLNLGTSKTPAGDLCSSIPEIYTSMRFTRQWDLLKL